MRLHHLDLLKYGKFTATRLDFPKTFPHDFHVVVGPNEAGKSTLRSAITELLFGMQVRSPLGFHHPLSELRLGGAIQNEQGEELHFHRSRQRNSLRRPDDEALPDNRLIPFLGSADRSFFEQMFGLDHTQLVRGGQSILDSSKDVGQALFQSAAGIASLGAVRERLAAQAALLWGPRQTKHGQYAQAARAFEEAGAELKAVQVKTKVWLEARHARDEAEQAVQSEQAQRLVLERERSRLERVRRLAPELAKLREAQAGLQALGEVVVFPPDAQAELSRGQSDLSAAQVLLDARRADLRQREAEAQAIAPDAAVLARAPAIESLDALRHQCRHHARDLLLLQAEVDGWLSQAKAAGLELGWPQDEGGLRAHLPTSLALRTVGNLLRDRGALHQAMQGTAQAVSQKQREFDHVATQLAQEGEAGEGGAAEPSPGLREAVDNAHAFKASPARQEDLAHALAQAHGHLDEALAVLGEWSLPIEALRRLPLPPAERVAARVRDLDDRRMATARARERLDEARSAADQAERDVRHFAQSHALVTATEVQAARTARDGQWDTLKHGRQPLAEGAPLLDAAMRLADRLVDTQLGAANEAAGLLARQQRLENAQAEVARLEAALAAREAESAAGDVLWQELVQASRLSAMPPADVAGWMARRDAALAAAAEVAERQRALDLERAGHDAARAALRAALQASRVVPPGVDDDLNAQVAIAQRYLTAIEAARQRRQALRQQHDQARHALESLQAEARSAAERHAEWQGHWQAALRQARLESAAATPAQAEGAVELAQQVAQLLTRARETQEQRIDPMRRDLARFAAEARCLALQVEPAAALVDNEDPSAIGLRLNERLRHAQAAAQRADQARQALRLVQGQHDEAQLDVKAAQARLRPLFDRAGTDRMEEVIPLVDRSDRRRQFQQALDRARARLIEDGDGLALEAIEADVAAQPAAEVPALREQVEQRLSEVNERLSLRAQDQARAEHALAAIAGQSLAATAEARRQEALAAMGEAAEQYVQVATASKLLKWAIDRYRDRQQGPMLQRASHVFSAVTLGDFVKLAVNHENDPPTLYAQRAGGQVVEVAGLSEGTRDQLYLALRIAALEQYLAQAPALPFIADDLFVNFDDERSAAGLAALRELSMRTQVIFLSHHHHLVPIVQRVFGEGVNVLSLERRSVRQAA